jgi:DNA replication and repair protein RecF
LRILTIKTLSINHLHLINFRNHQNLRLELAQEPVILTGTNGAGKTNILEAISFLSPGRGIRTAKLEDIDYNHIHPWRINASVNSVYGKTDISIFREHKEGSSKKILINDQNIKSQLELAKIFSLIWLTPQMDQIFMAESAARRRFLDRLVYNFDPEHVSRLSRYEASMRQRAHLLKQHQPDPIWLSSLEHSLAESGAAIAFARVQYAEYLQTVLDLADSSFPKARVMVKGEIESLTAEMPALQLEEHFKNKLLKSRQLDSGNGRTNVGIHRSDLIVYHADKNIQASLCSTGEQKILLLSLVLAKARAVMKFSSAVPVLLLDEVTAHLDSEKRAALFDEICLMKAQSWLTGTDVEVFSSLKQKAQFFSIK